jgi:hypothetical protein
MKALNMYISVIKQERSKIGKKSGKRKRANQPKNNKEMSINIISTQKKRLLKDSREKFNEASDMIVEGKYYQKKFH